MRLVWNPHSSQLTRSVQLGEIDCVPPVSLDPVTGLAGDQRWSDYNASMSARSQLPLDSVAAGPGLVTEPQVAATASQFCSRHLQRSRRVSDLSVLAHFPSLAGRGKRDRNRILVNIKADVDDKLFHDPSPMHEALHRTIQRNPRKPAYCETGRPISGEHVV